MSELKPCPFCGGEARIDTEYDMDGFGNFHKVECKSCGASSKAHFCSQGNECPQYYQEVRDEWQCRVETETEKRLTAMATKNAKRADELYEALESTNKELYFLINEINKYRTKDVRCDQLDPPELYDMETCHLNAVLLQKLRTESDGK